MSGLPVSQAKQKDPAMLGPSGYDRIADDFYPTPPRYFDCLAHFIAMHQLIIWEPACGEGHLSKRMGELGAKVYSTDLVARGFGAAGVDFLLTTSTPRNTTAIITNPPYGSLAEQFVRKALEHMQKVGGVVAMFMRTDWDTSSSDRPDLFEGHPAYVMKIIVTERPRWFERKKGDKSPRFSFAWYVWDWSKPAGQLPNIRYIHPRDAQPLTLAQAA
jgi:hypothetical protein